VAALGCAEAERSLEDEALALHRAAIVVDTHADTTPWFQDPEWRFDERHELGHSDLPRIREGGLDAQFWSIYVGRRESPGAALREALERVDAVHRMVERYADQTELATSAPAVRRIVAQGKLASLMGIEGGHVLEGSLAALRTFHRLGVRYLTLTHAWNNELADSSGTGQTPAPTHGGLSPQGEQMVREAGRLGMMVDVSHASDDAFWDVLRIARAPVIASHSSARAVADHPRNLSDDMLRALADGGGVAMINFYPGYIDEETARRAERHAEELRPALEGLLPAGEPLERMRALRRFRAEHPWPSAPLARLVDHFDHAIRVAGPDHVGIGADMDGVPSMPVGLEDVSRLPRLTVELRRRGHSAETVRKVLGANLLRVMEDCQGGAQRRRRSGDGAGGAPGPEG
jgi:membrane dipeptidase